MPRLLLPGVALAAVSFLSVSAHAVIVQGTVTSALGRPVPGARIQLIDLSAGTRSVANAVSGLDGAYEIRTDLAGRFVLLTSSYSFAPQISPAFYGGRTNLITRNIALDAASITPRLSDLPTGLATPLAQLSARVTQIPADRLTPRAFLADELPLAPAAILNEAGQAGQPAFLSLQGANPDAHNVLLDGVPVQPIGRAFNFGPPSATGFATIDAAPAVQLAAGPNPLYPLSSQAGTVALATAHASNTRPVFLYSGDAGNLHTWRDEATLALTHTRTDLFAAFSRFDTSNAIANDRFHSVAAAANLGYNISANTSLRLTLRDQLSAAPLPIPYDLGLMPSTKQATQDLAGAFTFETRTAGNWHNLLRYGLVRQREQTFAYLNPTGRPITLTGANGNTVSGQAAPFPIPPRQDQVSNRDEAAFETDYPLTRWLTGLFTFRYEDERALNAAAPVSVTVRQSGERANLLFAASLQGRLKHRLFYEASGNLTHSSLLGFTGAPRGGLTYVPVLAGSRRLKGTSLHLSAATGQREPSLAEQAQNLLIPARSRSLGLFADQNLYRQKLILHAGYFNNQFSHQTEVLSLNAPTPSTPNGRQGIGPTLAGGQAFRTQGFASELRYQPRSRLLLTGGYTYLASLVERSAAIAAFNPAFPLLPIGATTALAGQRPFRRPPNSGFFAVQYTGRAFAASLQGSLAGRGDDSTFTAATPSLLLPNRNLDHGYARLDAGFSYALLKHTTVFTQFSNLLNSQHIAPIGYPSTPFTFRSGLKIRIGGE